MLSFPGGLRLKKRPILFLVCLIILTTGCQATLSRFLPPLEEEGEVLLYTEPFPQESDRLSFSLEAIDAVSSDGREFPLAVVLPEIKPLDTRRQRLLASGRLPPGSYIGFSFKVKKAALKMEEGEANLLLPGAPVRNDCSFQVTRKRAQVISLTFKYAESILNGFSFSPLFAMVIPARPIPGLTGLVSNLGSNHVSIFDKKSNKVLAVIATGGGPAGIALDQRLGRAYVALSREDAIDFIDILAGEVISRIRLNTGDQPYELALTPDGKTLLVANRGTNAVSFVDPFSLVEVNRIDVGKEPNSVLIHPNGTRAFVFNTLSSTLSVIDIPNKSVVATLSTDPGPLRGQFNRQGNKLYVIHEWSSYLTVIDPFSLSLVKRYSVRMGMASIKVDIQNDLVYLGRGRETMVEVYDPFSFVVVDTINTGGGITQMAIDGDERNLYMLDPEMNSLTVSRLVRKKVFAEIDVGESPYWVTMMGER
jgi:YVTN family beta-propeller protein